MTPYDVLQLQRLAGNAAVHRVLAPVQRAGGGAPVVQPQTWADRVAQAQQLAQDPAQRTAAETLYKDMIVEASANVTARKPLVDRKPGAADIQWSWKTDPEHPHGAEMDGKRVDDDPQDHWRWVTFSPGSVTAEGKAVTEGYLIHELDHAAHAKSVYDNSATRRGAQSWEAYWVAHVQGTQDPAITVEGGALAAGLPKTIRPSVIEFRAYANQLIQTFHRVDATRHAYLARAVVMFLPLGLTNPAGMKDVDAEMDAKKTLLDLNLYTVGLNRVNRDARLLLAHEMQAALVHRQGSRAALEALLPILKAQPLSPRQAEEARQRYRPSQ